MFLRKLTALLHPCTLYIKVSRNSFHVRHIEQGSETTRHCLEPFTSSRLLVGDFLPAEKCLSDAIQELLGRSRYYKAPRVVIQQMEMMEHGLSPVEERVLLELAYGAGAYAASVWQGDILSDAQVLNRAKAS